MHFMSVLIAETVLLDGLQLLMLFERMLAYLEPKLFFLSAFHITTSLLLKY
jgi:hypothetical protein